MERLQRVESAVIKSELSFKLCEDLLPRTNGFEEESLQVEGEKSEIATYKVKNEKLRLLSTDLAIYLYYAQTLLDVFNLYSTTDHWKAAEGTNTFDDIAYVRSYLSSDTWTALSAISKIRVACHLPITRVTTFIQ